MFKFITKYDFVEKVGPADLALLVGFWPIGFKQLNRFTSIDRFICLGGLETMVPDVLGLISQVGQGFLCLLFCFDVVLLCFYFCGSKSIFGLIFW